MKKAKPDPKGPPPGFYVRYRESTIYARNVLGPWEVTVGREAFAAESLAEARALVDEKLGGGSP